ncbi:MAG: hypothetical protein ACOC80_10150 [Petrotogales bacterium]
MPKAKLEFDLPEEEFELFQATHAWMLTSIIWDMDEWLRNRIKHFDRDEFQEVREELINIVESYNLSMDQIKR